MKKRIVALVMAVFLLMSVSVFACADTAGAEGRKSAVVVALFMEDENGDIEGLSRGTGFFIGKSGENPKYLLTNYHVIETFVEYGNGNWKTLVDKDGDEIGGVKMHTRVYFNSDEYVEAYPVASDENQDVAVLKLDAATDKRQPLKLRVPDESMVGESLYCVGYPGIADAIESTSSWSETDSVITKGTLGRLVTTTGSGTKWIQTGDTDFTHGNSGGPMIVDSGAAVGIARGYLSEKDSSYEVRYAVSMEAVLPLLDKNSVPYELEKGSGSFPVIPVAIGAAAVIAVIAVLALKGKKKGSKKNQNPENEIKEVKVAAPVVRSMATQHNGMTVRLNGRKINIGRQPSNDIVFQKDTRGVSGNHCSVSWDADRNQFVLVDLGSTYGTFLATGQKLNPNVEYRLQAGDHFYLGDSSNMLHLEVE